MSEANVELIRRAFEAYEHGDLETMLADADRDLVVHRAPPQPDAGTWHGPEGMIEAFAGWIEGLDEFSVTVEEYIDANDSQVLVRTHQRGVGGESGVPVEGDFWMLHTVSAGKIIRVDFYADKEEARRAAGIP